jgi:hypothetical protein
MDAGIYASLRPLCLPGPAPRATSTLAHSETGKRRHLHLQDSLKSRNRGPFPLLTIIGLSRVGAQAAIS